MPLSIISKMIKWLPTPQVLCSWPYSPTPKAKSDPHFMVVACGCSCSSCTFNSKLVTYFSPGALQWDQKSNQPWFSNHKSAQEIRVAICPSNLARKFVSFFSTCLSACASFSQRESFNRSRNSGNEKLLKCQHFLFWWRIFISDMSSKDNNCTKFDLD